MVDVSGIGTQGYSSPYNTQYQLTGNEQQLSPYDNLTIWQAATQSAVMQNAENSMQQGLFGDYDEALEYATEIAGSISINAEGETYNEQMDALVQSHINAYDNAEAPDGKISYDEFVMEEVIEYNAFFGQDTDMISLEYAYSDPEFTESFKFIDLNKDNAIDADEIKAYYLMADMYDAAENPPQNPDDVLDGIIKFSSFSKIGDIMTAEAPEGSEAAEMRDNLQAAMIEIYNSFAAEPITREQPPANPIEPQTQPASIKDLQCEEPTALGKTIIAIEKDIFNNPFA